MISRPHWNRGFTFIELLIVICLVSILVMLFIPMYTTLRDKARDAACVANLRILQLGATTYMQDHDEIWPQMPEDLDMGASEEPMWEWWYNELKDYGVSKKHWICSSEVESDIHRDSLTEEFYGSYIPTGFEPTPRVAYMWNQPWFMERGQFHGPKHGPNIAMPDGTIRQGPALFGLQE